MKYVTLFIISFNLSAALWNYNDIDTITDWNQQIDLKQEKLIDFIYDEVAWNYFVGDDGEECEGWLEEIKLVRSSADLKSFTLHIEAQLEEKFGCIWHLPLICTADFSWQEKRLESFPNHWKTSLLCDYDFNKK